MDKPLCKTCNSKHWPREGHKFGRTDVIATTAGKVTTETVVVHKDDRSDAKPSVGQDLIAAMVLDDVTKPLPVIDVFVCPTCGHRRAMTGAERQRAFRERKTGC